MDLAERLEALQARNSEPLPENTPIYKDEEAKALFLTGLEEGKTIPEAAAATGRSATWFRRRRSPSSRNYDVDFSNLFDEIMAMGGSNNEGLSLRALTALVNACESGDVRAAEKILTAYHPDFQFMRPQGAIGDVSIERFQVLLPQIPTELLLQMKEALQRGQNPELPAIDA